MNSTMNVKLSNLQLNKLKSAIKNKTGVVLRLSSNMIRNSDDETNFPHKLLLANRQVTNFHKTFANNSLTDINLSKTPLSNLIQSEVILRRLLGPLWNVIKPLAKSVLIPLKLAEAA